MPDAHLLTKFHVFSHFDHVNITILKIWNHFAIILFRKESKTAVGIKEFLFWNFDFLQPWRPLTANKKLSKNYEKNIFRFSFYFWIRIAGTILGLLCDGGFPGRSILRKYPLHVLTSFVFSIILPTGCFSLCWIYTILLLEPSSEPSRNIM